MQTNSNTFYAIFLISGKVKKFLILVKLDYSHIIFILVIPSVPNNWTTIVIKVLESGFLLFLS